MKVPFTSRPHLSKPSTNFLKSRHSVVLEGFGQFLKLKCPTQSMMSRTNSGMSQVKILSDLGSKWKRKFSSTLTGIRDRKETNKVACRSRCFQPRSAATDRTFQLLFQSSSFRKARAELYRRTLHQRRRQSCGNCSL
jgi:hypothetical protein